MDKERLINIIVCIPLTGNVLKALYIIKTKSLRIKKLNFKEVKLLLHHVKIIPSKKKKVTEEGQAMPI